MNIEFLTIDEILTIHKNQIELYGGSLGIRDLNLLESALAMPQAGFGDDYLHKDIYEMASAYLFHIVQNHPFIDGNKRVGLVSTLMFLYNNEIKLQINDKESLHEFVLNIAMGKVNKTEIADFLRKSIHQI